jgi:hypothetical protein
MTQRVGAQLHNEPIPTAERVALVRALAQEFERYLRPGERFEIASALDAEALSLTIRLRDPVGDQQLDLELALALVENQDAPPDELLTALRLPLLLTLGRELLHGFFSADRHVRFPPGWTPMPWQGLTVLVSSRQWSPRLEAEADALLAAHPELEQDEDEGEDEVPEVEA